MELDNEDADKGYNLILEPLSSWLDIDAKGLSPQMRKIPLERASLRHTRSLQIIKSSLRILLHIKWFTGLASF
jgi:hypothetical protein